MGSLDTWAGLSTGVNAGLSNYMKLRQIWNQEDREALAEKRATLAEERALREEVRQKAADARTAEVHGFNVGTLADVAAERNRLRAPVYNISGKLTEIPHLGSDERMEAYQMFTDAGFPAETMETKPRMEEFQKYLDRPETKSRIAELQMKAIDREIDRIKTESAGESPLGAAGAMSKINQLEKDRKRLTVTDPAEAAVFTREQTEEKTGRERDAETRAKEKHTTDQAKAVRDAKYAVGAINTSGEAAAMEAEATDPAEKAKWGKLKMSLKAAELEKAGEPARVRAAAEGLGGAGGKRAQTQTLAANKEGFKDVTAAIRKRIDDIENDKVTLGPGIDRNATLDNYRQMLMRMPGWERADSDLITTGKQPEYYYTLMRALSGGGETQDKPTDTAGPPAPVRTPSRVSLKIQPENAKQPPTGARQAPDGNWYVPDPQRPGKYLRWKG